MSRNSRVRDRGYVSSHVSIAAATYDMTSVLIILLSLAVVLVVALLVVVAVVQAVCVAQWCNRWRWYFRNLL
jgi:hypothetical protein